MWHIPQRRYLVHRHLTVGEKLSNVFQFMIYLIIYMLETNTERQLCTTTLCTKTNNVH